MIFTKKAQSNLIPHKGVLSYDTHDKKQVYRYIYKRVLQEFREAKTREIIKYFSTSLTLVAFLRSLDIEAVKNCKIKQSFSPKCQ